jgi:carbonic anhydrase/acetyltransferase-like protein (isoleucine patch superfamily)
MSVYSFQSNIPNVDTSAYIQDSATVIGSCTIGPGCSIWPGAVLRGDNDSITLESNVNVQDGAVIHVDTGHPATLHNGVSIGHLAMVHGATIGENTLIGMQAIILNDAVIGRNCIIGANTVIAAGKIIPDNSLVVGTPGRTVREVTVEEIAGNKQNALNYSAKANMYKTGLVKIK